MSRIILLPGIHTSPHSRRMLEMREHIERGSELDTLYHEYGDIFAIETRWKNPGIAKELLPLIRIGDVLVGHSNGCAILKRCLDLGAPAVGWVCLNGALKDNIEIPWQVRFMHVYYNKRDDVVPLTNFPVLRKLAFDPFWGDMGRDGYTGKDLRVWQLDCGSTDDAQPDLVGHSSIIDPANSKAWGEFIGIQIKAALKEIA